MKFNVYRDEGEIAKELSETIFIDSEKFENDAHIWTVETVCDFDLSNKSMQTLPACIGIKDNIKTFIIAPNPAHNEITITSEISFHTIEVYDIYGRKLSTFNSPLSTINISHLQSGIYFVRIETSAGSVMKKIVKN